MEQRLKIAKNAILKAGDYLKKEFYNRHHVLMKADDTELLDEDLKSEEILMSEISKFFPADSFLTEERETEIKSDKIWVFDPICGSYYYLRGVETWSISMAFISENQYLIGGVYQPLLGNLFWSEKGKGTFGNNKIIHVSDIDEIDKAFISVELGIFRSKRFDILKLAQNVKRLRTSGGTGGELSYVAAGYLDGLIKTNQALMHFAGGRAILEEAGGVFLDFSGKPAPTFLDRNKTIDYIACNKNLASELLKYVAV